MSDRHACVLIEKPEDPGATPFGSIWDDPVNPHKGPDGLSLFINTPGGVWHLDAPAPADWEPRRWGFYGRLGTPPNISYRPMIYIPPPVSYHGNVRNGVLRHCLCRTVPLPWHELIR